MNDAERAAVGTTYKQKGQAAAIALGHELVAGKIKEERLEAWVQWIRQKEEAVIYCFRGGLRSQTVRKWLAERGVHRPLLEGGYKRARRFLREELERFSEEKKALVLSGPTGSAKTRLLNEVSAFYPVLDLEGHARHRGSAFGAWPVAQPNQVDFEHSVTVAMMKLSSLDEEKKKLPFLLEDESRLIGKCALPESLFARLRASEVIRVEVSFEERVENIFQDYVVLTAIGHGERPQALRQFELYTQAVKLISKKLGGLRAQEVLEDLENSKAKYLADERDLDSNRVWIAKLLSFYYDPLYAASFVRRNPKVIFQGSAEEIRGYLK